MDAWNIEKSEHIVTGIANIVDLIKSQSNLPPEFEEEIWFYLDSVIWDATKILAFSCNAEWSTEDRSIIIEKGYAGYEEIAVKYGLLDETSESKWNKKVTLFLHKLCELLEGDRVPNRTFIHELLASCVIKHEIITELSILIDQVTMGELAWQEFVSIATFKINFLIEDLNIPNFSKAIKNEL